MFSSVRVRLTLWYVMIFGSLLVVFSLFVYFEISRELRNRLNHSLADQMETVASFFKDETTENPNGPIFGAIEAFEEIRVLNTSLAVFENDRLLASNYPESENINMPDGFISQAAESERPVFADVTGFGSDGARIAAVRVDARGKSFIVLLAMPMRDLVAEIKTIRRTIYLWLPVTLIVAGMGGFLLAGKSLAPVVSMSDQAARISSTNLHDRLRIGNSRDELGRLALVFNDLLSRLDHSFDSLRTFMADASHELRTPLAIIRGEADVALSQNRNVAEYKETLTVIQDEAARLSHIVNDMLALARADAGQSSLNREEFYLNDLVEECCKSAQVLAASKGIALGLASSADIAFRGDQEMLRRLMMNLLDNAIKYTSVGGSVEVRVKQSRSEAEIEVADTGIGIPAEAAGRVFERFYRVDEARARADGGSGLGLPIAKWAAESHGGSIHLTSQPGRGSIFTVRLPI